MVKRKEHPLYMKYFKMLAIGLPIGAVRVLLRFSPPTHTHPASPTTKSPPQHTIN